MATKIVVATDGSDTGRRAVDFAATLSRRFHQPLCIVHVLLHGRPSAEFARMAEVEHLVSPGLPLEPEARAANATALGAILPGAEDEIATSRMIAAIGEHIVKSARESAEEAGAQEVTTRLCAGDTADEILDVAEVEGAGIIVLGRRGLGRLREMLVGSVSQKVLHHAACTVIIVP